MERSPGLEGLEIRRATPEDDAQVLDLMRETHGWRPEEPNEALFRWKHRENPFGVSPSWVALDGGRVVGFRTFMRWEFLDGNDRPVTAVRAVDTATAEGYRGRGVFRALTLQAVGELTLEGVGIVYNTPNDMSRPGYLKMGWSTVGRIPIGILPSGTRRLRRIASARVPAERWSTRTDVGFNAAEILSDTDVGSALLQHAPAAGFRTRRTAEYLFWRTSLDPLHYRMWLLDPDEPTRGGIVFRLRNRGPAVEAVIAEVLLPRTGDMWRSSRDLIHATRADYALAVRAGAARTLLPVPLHGPTLTTRPLAASPPSTANWRLSMADVELM